MVEIITTDEFLTWYNALDAAQTKSVFRVVGVLEQDGVSLRFPLSSALTGSNYPVRELRIQSGGAPLRVAYIFDPTRNAVLLLGGDKTGKTDEQFYEWFISRAEKIWEQYKVEQGIK